MIELSTWTSSDNVLGVKPDLVFYLEVRSGSTSSIGLFLLSKLSSISFGFEMIRDFDHGSSDVGSRAVLCRSCLAWLNGIELPEWIVAEIREEGRHFSSLGSVIVGRELCKGEPLFSIFLKITDVGSQILFHDGVEAFRLSVGRSVIRCRKFDLNFQNLAESSSEVSDELSSSIRDDGLRKAVKSKDVSNVEVCKLFRCCCVSTEN
jgi:hypothetical protein